MLQEDKEQPYRIIVVSSTFDSNYSLLGELGIDREDILDPDSPETPFMIDQIVAQERDDLVRYHEEMELYKLFMKQVKKKNIQDEEQFDEMLLMFYDPNTNCFEKPKHRYDGKKVSVLVFLDDCLQSKVLSSKKMSNIIIRNRHTAPFEPEFQEKYPQFGASMGCFIYITTQAWKAVGGGVPRPVRTNCSQMYLWKTASQVELDSIYEAVCGEIDYETFMKVYSYATQEKHDFLLVDLAPKPHFPSIFRKGFSEFIVP